VDQQQPVHIPKPLFARLQKLAVPLVDDLPSVIERLLAHWELTHNRSNAAVASPAAITTWRTPDGDELAVGETLYAKYLGRRFDAQVGINEIVFDGKSYPSLSAAGRAVKKKSGKTGKTVITNGRQFWKAKNAGGQLVKVIDRMPRKV
jgi:hypothetical protein